MANKTFKNWKELEKQLQKDINSVLMNKVADVVRDEIIMSVDSTVYDAGEPQHYQRRGLSEYSEGLGGRSQMIANIISNGILQVVNNAKPKGYDLGSDKSLAEWIEFGYGSKSAWWNQPRPFMAEARKALKENKNHVEAMKEGLEDMGYKVVK